MDKKIVVLIRAGLPYKKTILYGYERAKEIGAKLMLIGVIPSLDAPRRVALSMFEFGSYDVISKNLEREAGEYLDRAVQFCLDRGVVVETRVENGGLQGVIKQATDDKNTKLVIIPTPTKQEHHSEFLEAIKHFAHDILEPEIRCPVVSVLTA